MNLHEIYGMLVRRGMPEHPNLWHFGGPEIGHKYEGGDGGPFPAEDAHDLITMHALRWWLGLGGKFGSRPRQNVHLLEVSPESATASINTPRNGACGPDWEESTILAAILAATEHLEPKGADDAKRP